MPIIPRVAFGDDSLSFVGDGSAKPPFYGYLAKVDALLNANGGDWVALRLARLDMLDVACSMLSICRPGLKVVLDNNVIWVSAH